MKLCEILIFLYLWRQNCCHTEFFFLESSIYCAYRWIFKRNTAISKIAIDQTHLKYMTKMQIYNKFHPLCIVGLLWQWACVNARYVTCLNRPIVIINQ